MGNRPKYHRSGFLRPDTKIMLVLAAGLVTVVPTIAYMMQPEPIPCGNTVVTGYAISGLGMEAAINHGLAELGMEVSNAHEAALTASPRNWDVTNSVTFQLEEGNERICKIDGKQVLG